MTEHTPGPLYVTGPSSGKLNSDDGGDYCIYVEVDGKRHIVGEAFRLADYDTQYPAKGNATLWAAAPELLDFAKTVCGLHRHAKPDDIQRIIGQAQQLVAKARGQETGG